IDLPIDPWPLHAGRSATSPPVHLAPHAALAFVLLGSALLAIGMGSPRSRRISQGLALGAFSLSLTGLIGYVLGARVMYGAAELGRMAAGTAVSILALSLGVLFARTDLGLSRLVLSATS